MFWATNIRTLNIRCELVGILKRKTEIVIIALHWYITVTTPSHVRSRIMVKCHTLKKEMRSKVRLKNAGSKKRQGYGF